MTLFGDGDNWAFGIGEPPVRKALAGVFGDSTFLMVDEERVAFTPANIACRTDVEGKFSTFVDGGDDGDSRSEIIPDFVQLLMSYLRICLELPLEI